ncbi:MAG: phage head closure protein [Alphaproteobacteria bacterium]|jgi:SPP1 family predicted phage head-tail adaptor|nr:phage head closure protein [Thalassospira sp.]MCE2965491.1 phage head closure protein [Alphaproteobacteria bacterium]
MHADLNERITLQTLNNASDTAGGKTRSWTSAGDVWAAVDSKALPEDLRGNALRTGTLYTITVHGDTTLSADMRILWRGKTLRILRLPDVPPRYLYRTLECVSADTLG